MRSYMHGHKNTAAEMEPEAAAAAALSCFLGEQDEDRLVLRDYRGDEYPW